MNLRNKIKILSVLFGGVLRILYTQEIFDGYTLITPKEEPYKTQLIDNDYNVINEWDHECKVASMGYLSTDSTLLYPCEQDEIYTPISAQGGRIIKYDWNGNILWDWQCDWGYQLHHDIEPLENGNILAIAIEIIEPEVLPDVVLEIQPIGLDSAILIWDWHVWNHRGSNDPSKFDENVPYSKIDWNHFNAISINDDNRIYLSSRSWSEIYIIDWGGDSDILYRWGNPENYGRGDQYSRTLDANHGVNEIPSNYPGSGNILIFNNGTSETISGELYSNVIEITPPLIGDGTYYIHNDEPFGPLEAMWEFSNGFYSGPQSGAYRLPNGNTIVTVAQEWYIFEVTYEKEVVWEYISESSAIPRAKKYGVNYFSIFGDFNNDNVVNILDIIIIINCILIDTCDSTYDLNEDISIDILDIVLLINIIVLNP